jgi:hypothetical protein
MEEIEPLTFNELVNRITRSLIFNVDLNTPRSTRRFVQGITDTNVTISIGVNNYETILFENIYQLYTATIENNGIYNKQICLQILPNQTHNHGCTVHVVGMIFVRIDVMRIVDDRNYEII